MITEELVEQAEHGSVDAMITLAKAYFDKEAGEENQAKAFDLCMKAHELEPSNPMVINSLGICYHSGVGVVKDNEKALEYYRKASELGYASAQYNLAKELQKRSDPESLYWYQQAYENGNKNAPYKMAFIYLKGDIVSQDSSKYIEYLRNADALGNTFATVDLACAYLDGEYVEMDKARGIELMLKAANAGNSDAARNMALAYKKGDGVPPDMEQAVLWAIKAADLGNSEMIFGFAIAYYYGKAPFLEDKPKAVEYFILAANAGSIPAMEKLGVCYFNGYGVEPDLQKAIEWYEKAAKEGSGKAIDGLKEFYTRADPSTAAKKYYNVIKSIADDGNYHAMVKTYYNYRDGKGTEKDLSKAKEYLEAAVIGEDAAACFFMGLNYYKGEFGFEQDKKKAVELMKMAANKGYDRAAAALGVCYMEGDGIEQDNSAALFWFEKAKDLGNIDALIELGLAYDCNGFAGTDYPKAVSYYREAYEKGSLQGACCLACMYENGRGVEKHLGRAFELYKYAADHGDARGMARTGVMLSEGRGTQKNIEEAIRYLEKAKQAGWKDADNLLYLFVYSDPTESGVDAKRAFEFVLQLATKGDADAQYKVYKAYWNGLGVAKDEEKALRWLENAANSGSLAAQGMLGSHALSMGNAPKAVYYWEKAQAGGSTDAALELANLYLDGANGVPMNKARAIAIYRKMAEEGSAEAQCELGICYATGNGVPQNDMEAFRWYSIAAERGDAYAQKNLAILYRYGRGTPVNKFLAILWFEKASDQGLMQAKACLAGMYADGEGTVVDYNKAIRYYSEIIDNGEGEYYEIALFELAHIYATKTNNDQGAFPLWQQLASRGNTDAKFNLGLAYHNARGTPQNEALALYWWRQAAAEGHQEALKNVRTMERSLGRSATQSVNTVFCTHCGNPISHGAWFCPRCGSRLM